MGLDLLFDDFGKLFLNAAATSGDADFGFFGRGVWIDQPQAYKASQPRCTAILSTPNSGGGVIPAPRNTPGTLHFSP
ncbi:hypothetical protein ATO4_07925 [Aurantimonas sp. 22II-16-19i]|nr:hypothetical protein ATO4_07925 [Aurantimonas sp. 22II-16-19i]